MSFKNILTPDVGGTAEVIEVLVKVGDAVDANTSVVTLESDKATMEVPAGEVGVVTDIKVKIGDKVSVGHLLLVLSAAADEGKAESTSEIKEIKEIKLETSEEEALSSSLEFVDSNLDIHAGPGVRRFARDLGVDLAQLSGTGLKQRITKEDVNAYVKQQLTQLQTETATHQTNSSFSFPEFPLIDFAQFGEVRVQSLSRIKKIAGKLLQRNAMMIPHVTQFAEADITELEAYRATQKKQMDALNIKLTPLVFMMKALVAALKAFPHFNASLDVTGEQLILKQYFNIGVAVDTPEGLVVPVIRDVDQKGLKALAKELADISEKARQKLLTPKDMQGGCFSISSLGGIGGTAFTPIINSPEVAILGVSKAQHKPIYDVNSGEFSARLMLPLSLSYDHRVIDGADGARFMMYLSELLTDIRHLLM